MASHASNAPCPATSLSSAAPMHPHALLPPPHHGTGPADHLAVQRFHALIAERPDPRHVWPELLSVVPAVCQESQAVQLGVAGLRE